MDVDQLIEAGACFREKRKEYYKPNVDFAAALREDLRDTGVISSEEEETLGMAQTPPSTPSAETQALLQYYGDPEFVWPEEAVEQLLGCGITGRIDPLAALDRDRRPEGHAERSRIRSRIISAAARMASGMSRPGVQADAGARSIPVSSLGRALSHQHRRANCAALDSRPDHSRLAGRRSGDRARIDPR